MFDNRDDYNIKQLIVIAIISLIFGLGTIFLGGKVLMDMWNWFVVNLSSNINHMSYAVSLGIWLIIDGLLLSPILSHIDNHSQINKIDISELISLLLTWGIGAIVHLCI